MNIIVIGLGIMGKRRIRLIKEMYPDYAIFGIDQRDDRGVLDGYCEIVEMYDTGVLDLDHENDFELMEVVAKYLFEKYDCYKEIQNNIVVL
jgi:prephenate dehydrogenase